MTSPRLLLVDDDPDLGLVVRILARRCGHTLTHHLDAESAWAGLDARPDLVLLDVNLPGTSGLEFLRRVRASPDHGRQAVALFIQPALTQDIVAGWNAGADYHISKDLVTQLEAWQHRLDEIVAHLRSRESSSSLFIKDIVVSEDGLASLESLLHRSSLPGMTRELFQAMLVRAGATGSSKSDENRARFFRLIDQLGCLLGRTAVETILEGLQADRGNDEKPLGPVTTAR